MKLKKNMSKLKKLRLISSYSQAEIAKILSISQSYLSLLEREKVIPSPELQQKMDRLFSILEEIK